MDISQWSIDKTNPFHTKSLKNINTSYAKKFGVGWLEPGQTAIKKVQITDLPFMITADGTIVCIPKLEEMGVICVAGLTGNGKCIDENEKVIVNGESMTAKEIYKNFDEGNKMEVFSLNKNNYLIEKKEICGVEKAKKECVEVITNSGERILCSPDHKFLILNKNLDVIEKPIIKVEKGEYLLKAEYLPCDEGNSMLNFWDLDNDLGYICGIYLAEGNTNKTCINICNFDKEIQKKIIKICNHKNLNYTLLKDKKSINIKNKPLMKFIEYYFGKSSKNKFISKKIIKSNKNFKRGLLCGYFDGDGCINQCNFGWVTKSLNLCKGINLLLLSLGIANNYKKIKKKISLCSGNLKDYYEGNILNRIKFKRNIKFRKHSKIKYAKNKTDSDFYLLNFFGLKISKNKKFNLSGLLDKYKIMYFLSKRKKATTRQIANGINMTVAKTSKLVHILVRSKLIYKHFIGKKIVTGKFNNGRLKINHYYFSIKNLRFPIKPKDFIIKVKRIINSDFYLDEVKQIKKKGENKNMYHLEIKDNHNFMLENNILTCNTLCAGHILDNIFWNWEDNIGILNDSQEETFSWSEPSDTSEFNFQLKKIHQNPWPLPIIYLFPLSDRFEINEKLIENKNYAIISIPFEEVMKNVEKYIPDLGGSEKYLMNLKEDLLEARDEEELFQIIDDSIDSVKKGMSETKYKIKVSLKNLFDEGILNLSREDAPYQLGINYHSKTNYIGNPFTAIMKADCIPSFITSNLYTQKYKDAIFSYYLDCMFNESKSGSMQGKRVWLYFDELTRVVHTNPKFNASETEKALNNIASRGRINKISIIYATQRYKEIPHTIRSQTKFGVIFRHKKEDTKEICGDFGLGRNIKDEIIRLKKFEAMAVTTEYFVCYKGNERREIPGPIKGVIFPPLHRNTFLRRKG